VRDLARKRMQLVRSRTTNLLAVENVTARHQGARLSSAQVQRMTPEAIDQMGLRAESHWRCRPTWRSSKRSPSRSGCWKNDCPKTRTTSRVRVAQDCAWHRADSG
jgi:hypothetical protein